MSRTSVGYLCRSAQRRYIRSSICAKSAASTPPASERMVTSASRSSYSPDSRVRTSSASTACCSAASSASDSARLAASPSSWPSSTSTARSSSRERRLTTRSTSDCRADSREVTCWAFSGLSHRSGAATACSSSAISPRLRSGSTTASIERNAWFRSFSAVAKSGPATTGHSTDPLRAEPVEERSVTLVGGELLDPDEPLLTTGATLRPVPYPDHRERGQRADQGDDRAEHEHPHGDQTDDVQPGHHQRIPRGEPAVPGADRRVRHPGHHGQQRDHPGEDRQTTVESTGDQPDHRHQTDQPGQRAEGQGEVLVEHCGPR